MLELTEENIHEIRCYERKRAHHQGLADVYSRENIAKIFGISTRLVDAIAAGEAYGDVPYEYCPEGE